MKKLFSLFAIMMAFAFTAKAQTITVPAELNGWYAGFYVDSRSYETVCNRVMECYTADSLDANEWTATAQARLEVGIDWGNISATDVYYGQISNNTFTVGQNYAKSYFVAFFIVDNANLVAGANWRIYVPKAKGDYTLTDDDLVLQGTFGVGVTPTALDFTISYADGVVTATPNDNTVGYLMVVRDASFDAVLEFASYTDEVYFEIIKNAVFGKDDIKTGVSELDIVDKIYWIAHIDELVPGDYKAILAPCVASGVSAVRDGDIIVKNFTVVATPTALENTTATVKAQKTIENGQMIIIRDGKRYNAVGAEL